MASLQFSCLRRTFRYSRFVHEELAPFLGGLRPHTFSWVTSGSPHIFRTFSQQQLRSSSTSFSAIVRYFAQQNTLADGIQVLLWVERVYSRVQLLPSHSLISCTYEFDVGEVVVNRQLGHLGVVAARLPICFESDDWIIEHLGSLNDYRMVAPWYLLLLGHHRGVPLDFSRYGSELTHVRVSGVKSIGLNRHLPSYFQRFDSDSGRYISS